MIGEKIKKARLLAGLSQKQLGDAIGKGISTISEWESGKRSPDVELIPELGKILNVSQLFLMDLSDNPQQEVGDRIPDKFPPIKEDYALLDAYHSADKKTRTIVRMLLDIDEEDIL
jgi:transcriptional regulator with XRE-family HTH domain